MKIKKIRIPIYEYNLTVIVVECLSEIAEKYSLKDVERCAAITFKRKGDVFVAFSKLSNSTIAHEIVHIINYIFADCGAMLDLDNDEPQAYLTSYLFEQIEKITKSY